MTTMPSDATRTRTMRVRDRLDSIASADSDRSFVFTIVAIAAIAALGLIVVPMSIPDAPPPAPSQETVLGEQFLATFSAKDSPTAAAKLKAPSIDEVKNKYGTTGGDACSATPATLYRALFAGKGFDTAAYATTQVAQSVYCPDKATAYTSYVTKQNAARRAARLEAAETAEAAA